VATIDATPANVAALLRARTKDAGGNELGQWTPETRPTLAQVQETLDLAAGVVTARVGEPVDACASSFAVAVSECQAGNLPDGSGTERAWQVYDVCTPGSASLGGDWPPEWWQRDLENPMLP
jgi:hypothetical protein